MIALYTPSCIDKLLYTTSFDGRLYKLGMKKICLPRGDLPDPMEAIGCHMKHTGVHVWVAAL